MVQHSILIVEAKQKRSDNFAFARIAKSADNAICRAQSFNLYHTVAIAGVVRLVRALGHHAIESHSSKIAHPSLRQMQLPRRRRKPDAAISRNALEKTFQRVPPLFERSPREQLSLSIDQQIKAQECNRRLLREAPDPAVRWMNSLQ